MELNGLEYTFSGDHVSSRSASGNEVTELVKNQWPGLPDQTIDAATVNSQYVFFFFGDFFYTATHQMANGEKVLGPYITTYPHCDKYDYSRSEASARLGIRNEQSYKKYISQFAPDRKVTTVKPSTVTLKRSSVKSTSASTMIILITVITIPPLICLAFLVKLVICNRPRAVTWDDTTTVPTVDSVSDERLASKTSTTDKPK
ncbi:hypothetical protein HDE_13051 [Halotydeus destructor]|nr:hypothetical protein HDE_13051 [Halotydeus destructor]